MMTQSKNIQKATENVIFETNAVSVYLHDTFNNLSNLSNKKFIENVILILIVAKEVECCCS